MHQPKLTSEFVVTAFELANDLPAKVNFLTVLERAAARRVKIAEVGYRAAYMAAFDQDADVRSAAFNALRTIHRKRSSLVTQIDADQIVQCAIKDGIERKSLPAHGLHFITELSWTPELAETVYGTLTNICENGKSEVERDLAFCRLMGFVHEEGYLERMITVAKTYIGDRNPGIRGQVVRTLSHYFQLHPHLAESGDLVRLATMALKDPDEDIRKSAGHGIRIFVEKHPDRADDLLPNKRLIDVTTRLHAIAVG